MENNETSFNKDIEILLKEIYIKVKNNPNSNISDLIYRMVTDIKDNKEQRQEIAKLVSNRVFSIYPTLRFTTRNDLNDNEELVTTFIYDENSSINSEYKIYLSIKEEKKLDIVKKLFYIISMYQDDNNNSLGQTKFRTDNSNDEIVFRLSNEKQLKEIINYILNDKEIMYYLNKPNIFVPQYKGISILTDNGLSFNGYIQENIEEYILMCIENNKEPDIKELYKYIKENGLSYFRELDDEEEKILAEYKKIFIAKILGIDDNLILKDILNINPESLTIEENKSQAATIKGPVEQLLEELISDKDSPKNKFVKYQQMYDFIQRRKQNRFEGTQDKKELIDTLGTKNAKYNLIFSIKPDKYEETVDKIQKIYAIFAKTHNLGKSIIKSQAKSDGIILKFTTQEDLEEFLEIIESTPEIKESFDKPSPILPSINGIMYMYGDYNNYKNFILNCLKNYINNCKKERKATSLEELKQEIANLIFEKLDIRTKKRIGNKETLETYKQIMISLIDKKDNEEIITTMFGNNPSQGLIK